RLPQHCHKKSPGTWKTQPSKGVFSISAMCWRRKAVSGSSQPNSMSFFVGRVACAKTEFAKRQAPSESVRAIRAKSMRTGLRGFRRGFQCGEHGVEGVLAVVADAVDEKGGRSVDAAADAGAKVLADRFGEFFARQV